MGGQGYIDAEIRVNPRLTVSEAHHIAFSLEQQIKTELPKIIDVGIHVDPLSEFGHHWVTDLPSREEILDRLNSQWSSIDCSNKIHEIRLHYLSSRVEIELFLPFELAAIGFQLEIDELVEQASKIDFVEQVYIYFER